MLRGSNWGRNFNLENQRGSFRCWTSPLADAYRNPYRTEADLLSPTSQESYWFHNLQRNLRTRTTPVHEGTTTGSPETGPWAAESEKIVKETERFLKISDDRRSVWVSRRLSEQRKQEGGVWSTFSLGESGKVRVGVSEITKTSSS